MIEISKEKEELLKVIIHWYLKNYSEENQNENISLDAMNIRLNHVLDRLYDYNDERQFSDEEIVFIKGSVSEAVNHRTEVVEYAEEFDISINEDNIWDIYEWILHY